MLRWASGLCALAGLGYCGFVLVWGLNHARQPYAVHANLQVESQASSASLADLVRSLAAECDELRAVVRSEDLPLQRNEQDQDVRVLGAFAALAGEVPALAGPDPLVRVPLVSPVLSRLGIAGIYSPFTAESHVNGEMPAWRMLYTACHEIAHARGFAREDEANYIAWQAGRRSPDPALRYSATASALSAALVALGRQDPDTVREVWEGLSPEVLADFEESQRFWRARRSAFTRVARGTNDLYLKSQGQRAKAWRATGEWWISCWRSGSRPGGRLPH